MGLVLENRPPHGLLGYSRGEGGEWAIQPCAAGKNVILSSLDIAMSIDEIYEDVDFASN